MKDISVELLPGSLTFKCNESPDYSCTISVNVVLSLAIVANKLSTEGSWSMYGTLEPYMKTKQGRRAFRISLSPCCVRTTYNCHVCAQLVTRVNDAIQFMNMRPIVIACPAQSLFACRLSSCIPPPAPYQHAHHS
jgi:hypothetical protein